ncbi:MAG: hypothetical protein KUG77_14865, partial [Nannocystaceae bacterium]|nr:hypothetical protein [Nannocystaceae bacterium]
MILRCVLGAGLLLAPAVADAAPDDARPYDGPAEVSGAPDPPLKSAPGPSEAAPSNVLPQPEATVGAPPGPEPTKRFNPRIPKVDTRSGAVI